MFRCVFRLGIAIAAGGCSSELAATTDAGSDSDTSRQDAAEIDSATPIEDAGPQDATTVDASSDEVASDADECSAHDPPCPATCETILGTPAENGCFEYSHPIEIACRKIWGANSLSSCVINEATGEMYRLASSTYLFELLERGGWKDCPDGWQYLLSCDDACENYEPPCPQACETIVGTPVENGCFESSQSVEIACGAFSGTDGIVSCVINQATGEMYELASSTYLLELLERGGWASCPDSWQDIPYCQ